MVWHKGELIFLIKKIGLDGVVTVTPYEVVNAEFRKGSDQLGKFIHIRKKIRCERRYDGKKLRKRNIFDNRTISETLFRFPIIHDESGITRLYTIERCLRTDLNRVKLNDYTEFTQYEARSKESVRAENDVYRDEVVKKIRKKRENRKKRKKLRNRIRK